MGKTIVAAWLASAVTFLPSVAIVKAVQTGAFPSIDGDEAFYRAALRRSGVTTATIVSLAEPLAPSIAARRAGTRVILDNLAQDCLNIAAAHDLTIVEGSGGLLAPIDDNANFADLAGYLKAPLIIVLRPGLGTLNHTLLTLEAAFRRELSVEMLVCSGLAPDLPIVEIENLQFLHERYPSIPLVVLQRVPSEKLTDLSSLQPQLIGNMPPLLSQAQLEDFTEALEKHGSHPHSESG